MRVTTLASVAIPCLGFSVSSMAAEDVMVVTASGYEKKLDLPLYFQTSVIT